MSKSRNIADLGSNDVLETTATGVNVTGRITTDGIIEDTSGNVGIGTSSPRAQQHIFGLGQATTALTDAGARGGMLRVSDDNASAGSGGAILFASSQGDAANSLGFAAIKGSLTNGSNNTAGDMVFSTRNASTDTSLTERMRIDSGGNLKFNSGYGSVATAYGCRAWVNFNGTGTVAIRASGNVSSITDVSKGRYIVNFTTAMPDANFVTNFSANAFRPRVNTYTAPTTTTSPDLTTWNSTGVVADSATCLATFFR